MRLITLLCSVCSLKEGSAPCSPPKNFFIPSVANPLSKSTSLRWVFTNLRKNFPLGFVEVLFPVALFLFFFCFFLLSLERRCPSVHSSPPPCLYGVTRPVFLFCCISNLISAFIPVIFGPLSHGNPSSSPAGVVVFLSVIQEPVLTVNLPPVASYL